MARGVSTSLDMSGGWLHFTRTSIAPILIVVSAKRRVATMVSKTSPDPVWTGRRIDFPTFCAELSARRAAAGDPPVPRNAGNNRTASKRALLKAIEDAGGTW